MKRLVLAALCACLSAGGVSAQIYADFITSLGNFTCELNHAAAPKTVANFIGLADGTRAWVDPAGGAIRENKPFYDGLIFHRVIAGFMNQGGCPLGTGSSGPGYIFPDETSNGLNHLPYVISMANSGANTNGSQFFVIASQSQPHLNGIHTVFGNVVSGTPVIDQINAVATGPSDRPVTPVVIQHVGIRRVGSSAQAFDTTAWNLPQLSNLRCTLAVDLAKSVLAQPAAPRPGGTVTRVYRTGDLQGWAMTLSHCLGTGTPSASPLLADELAGFATSLSPKAFYRFAQAFHPDAIVPQSMASRTLRVNWGTRYFDFTFNAAGDEGSVFYSFDGLTRPVTRIHPAYSPYDWVFDVTGLGSLKVSANVTGETATTLDGPHKLHQWTGLAWSLIGAGTLALSK